MNMIPYDECESQLELFGYTTCGFCNRVIEQESATMKVWYDETQQQKEEHFCGENCKQSFYLRNLQQAGM